MNVDYDDDVRTLKEHARKLLEGRDALGLARQRLDRVGDDPGRALWQELGAQGWCGVQIDPEHGGLGMGMVALCGLAEEFGRLLPPVPFASSVYGFAQAIALAGNAGQQARLLPAIAGGSAVGTLALTEGPGAPFAAPPLARVEAGLLHGVKLPVADGLVADHAVVLADAPEGPSLFLVDLHGAGVARSPVSTLDPLRADARVEFHGSPAELLGAAGDGVALATRILARYAVPLAFEAIGGADACLEMAVAYAKARYAFGRPIGSYQAVKHRLAEMYVKNEMARSNAYYAAWAADHDDAGFEKAVAAARIAAGDAFWFAVKEAIQLHGGIGFTWEVDCHLYYRRSRRLAVSAGSAAWWGERLAQVLREEAA